jgi:hypothetical protein
MVGECGEAFAHNTSLRALEFDDAMDSEYTEVFFTFQLLLLSVLT